ncbi:IS110 family transposase [soil metagenome]
MKTQPTDLPKLYIGMDIHKKSWSVHLRTDISDHKTLTIPSDCDVLYDYVEKHFQGHEVSLTYEVGCCGFSASRRFMNLGWNVLVVNPADVPRLDKQNYQKTDKIDCRNLAKQLHAGQLKGIYIPDEAQDLLKSLLRQRAETSKQLRAIKSNIKGLLLYHGIEIPKEFDNPNWTKPFLQWLQLISWPHPTGKICIDSKLRMREVIHKEYLQLANELRSYCRKHHKRDYYLLKSIPGVGGYLASAILAEIGDLRRFNNEAQFASYIGIVPTMRNSGGTEKIQGVTPRCRGLLRSYIIESSWVALRMDPEMQAYYRKHIGRNPKSIIVKIARKLLNRMLAVIKTEQPYHTNYSLNNGKETKKTPMMQQNTSSN